MKTTLDPIYEYNRQDVKSTLALHKALPKRKPDVVIENGIITAFITRKDKSEYQLKYNSITTALEQCRGTLDIGDKFVIKEGNTKLASGKIEDYKL